MFDSSSKRLAKEKDFFVFFKYSSKFIKSHAIVVVFFFSFSKFNKEKAVHFNHNNRIESI